VAWGMGEYPGHGVHGVANMGEGGRGRAGQLGVRGRRGGGGGGWAGEGGRACVVPLAGMPAAHTHHVMDTSSELG
jgi:hypothetical protein